MSELTVRCDYEGLREIGPWLASLIAGFERPAPDGFESKVELAVHELATNCVDHADTATDSLTLRAHVDDGALSIELIDDGQPVNVEAIPTPGEEPQVRGYGLMIVEQLVTMLEYERIDDHNHWTARFDLSDAPTPQTNL